MRAVRLLKPVLFSSLILALSLSMAWAGDKAERKKEAPAKKAPAFSLKSAILSQIPEISEALAGVEAMPDNIVTWRMLGQALANHGGLKDAERALQIAVKVDKTVVESWVDLGAVQIRNGHPRRAVSSLKQALKIEPYHALAHYNLGLAHQALVHRKQAFESFETALSIDPTLGDPRTNPAAVVNPDLPYVKLAVYMKTIGRAPSVFAPIIEEGEDPGPRDEDVEQQVPAERPIKRR